jgi:thiol-disulfide isomerase/thioredoxin
MACELMGQEAEAKRWFGQLAQQYPRSPLAAKADGAVRRLELEGQALQLALPKLNDPNAAFNIDQLRGKVVVVYFWASWDKRCVEDFTRLKQLVNHFGDDRVDVLSVNLDNRPEEATAFLGGRLAPGVQVFQQGGLEGRVAKRYGPLLDRV